jgi:predicted PurR-regulated permease PerM
MRSFPLYKTIGVLFLFFLVIGGLHFTSEFFVPVTIAGILAMLFLPLSKRMEKKGLHKGLSAIICILVLLLVIAGVSALLSWQISDLAEDAGKMQERIMKTGEKAREYISNTLGISKDKQKEMMEKQKSSAGGNAGSMVSAILSGLMGVLVNTVLVLVYMFLFMFFRKHIRRFIMMLVPEKDKFKTESIIGQISKVAQQYLSGLGMMIVCLWIMYGIGFSIVGVKNAIFFAILCGLLEIIPFIGNLTGTSLTLLMVVTQGGDSKMILGVLATYLLIQFIQTYVLEPLVVGNKVNINPLFTILVIVAGEMIWGIPGMILAIPVLGMLKIVFDHVEPLKPYGYLVGEEKKSSGKN